MGDRGRVLVFGSYDATLHPRVGVLRDGLAARGWAVQELDAPLGAATSDKVAAAGSPSAALRLVGRQVRSWAGLVRRSRGEPDPDVVLVGYMGHADVHLARLRFRRSVIALDHLVGLADTVRDRGLGGGVALRVLDLRRSQCPARRGPGGRGHRVAGPDAPGAGAGAGRRRPGRGRPGVVRGPPRGCVRGRGAGPGLRVVFFGLYTPLQGATTIGRAIDLLREEPIEFTMIGHGQDLAEARELARGSCPGALGGLGGQRGAAGPRRGARRVPRASSGPVPRPSAWFPRRSTRALLPAVLW